ncbi:hypothetical protein TUM20985_48310 [Mycobacterium antarcticum]|uniref:glycosyl hydrolase family 28-related protein n=1 Tax=unclassified Mycolicibacterium TaxID=2636767 RepID=UPI0023925B3B|nr:MULTISPECIES: glycosyl hydrolase family 28-related protein [unclassified Mycolicibacterium]BDX34284.1 hypothetical protein TUM20985_48310 [Mycolicibacterium sp. TUM20985]GLP77494.1 hypothetical protein TUM20983_46040 [Mycolicibacterium sp. TUM20983]
MTLSRRRIMAIAPAAAALALAPSVQQRARTVVDVRAFGATGDGTTDDSRAIQAAAAATGSGCTLRFPSGTYRFAQRWPAGTAAIVINRVADVVVEFEPGAELLIDNLDPVTHTGTGHGLLVRGPASRISLRDVNIRWAARARRSLGDGIRVVGCPTPGEGAPVGWSGPLAPVDQVSMSDCVIRASPQTGVVMHGVSDITVDRLRVVDSRADGLHFNACRRARIADYDAVDTGDDGLALVTYYAPEFSFDDAAHTFAFPTLIDWSNADFTINDVRVHGSQANGIRIAGAHRVTVGGLVVTGAGAGSAVMADSAAPGTDVGWNYLASRGVRVEDLSATDCDTGIHLLARPGAVGDRQFTDFDVTIDEATLDDCSNWSVRAESLSDTTARGLRMGNCRISATSTTGGNGGVGLENTQQIALGDMSIRHANAVVAFRASNAEQLAVDRLEVTIGGSGPATGTPSPCVSLEDSDGTITAIDVYWPAAPPGWTAVRQSAAGRCSVDPAIVRALKVTPPGGSFVVTCP